MGIVYTIRFFAFWTFAVLTEMPYIWVFFGQHTRFFNQNWATIIAVHTMAALAIFFATPKDNGWFHHQRKWPRTFFFLTFFLPGFGVLMCLPLILFYPRKKDFSDIYDNDDLLFPESLLGDSLLNPQRFSNDMGQRLSAKTDFAPLVDIIKSGDIDLKRGAIDKLSKLATPEAVDILMEYRSDPSAEVRFYITSALSKVKDKFETNLEAARKELQHNVYNLENRFFLARTYHLYSQMAFVDPKLSAEFEEQAIYHLQFCIESGKAKPEVYHLLLQIHETKQDWQNATTLIDQMIANKVLSQHEGQLFKVRYHYEERDFSKFLREFKKLKDNEQIPDEWQQIARWWGVIG
ncbi:MAG: HEAT repeat domain-containing protein [Deltaproteobacteria bacterium]|nr:HEAT repeat domain-containing protein [Deltaproteobacteria bacterium]